MMTILALYEKALAISIICISETDSFATFSRGLMWMSSSLKIACVSANILAVSTNKPLVGYRPSQRLSITVSCFTKFSS